MPIWGIILCSHRSGNIGTEFLVASGNKNWELFLLRKRKALQTYRELLQISCQHWLQHWFLSLNIIFSVILRCCVCFVSVNICLLAKVSPFTGLLVLESVKSASSSSFLLILGNWTISVWTGTDKGTVLLLFLQGSAIPLSSRCSLLPPKLLLLATHRWLSRHGFQTKASAKAHVRPWCCGSPWV